MKRKKKKLLLKTYLFNCINIYLFYIMFYQNSIIISLSFIETTLRFNIYLIN